jgi:hypothetical protein
MPREDDSAPYTPSSPTSTSGGQQPAARVLKANYVEVPLDAPSGATASTADPHEQEFLKIRASYFAGETLTPQQIQKMMLRAVESGGGGTNGNCGIC